MTWPGGKQQLAHMHLYQPQDHRVYSKWAFFNQSRETALTSILRWRSPNVFHNFSTAKGRELMECAGCDAEEGKPQTGDVRLVPLDGSSTPTAACDQVHIGGVEIYNRGRWGGVCIGGGDRSEFTIDAQVVCRQLGFRSGVMYQTQQANQFPLDYGDFYSDQTDYTPPMDFVWATEVVCTGTEERLDECLFTEGSDNTLAGLPDDGVTDSCFGMLPVLCTQFDLIGASLGAS